MHYTLETPEWEALQERLNQDAVYKPNLAELLAEPDPWIDTESQKTYN